MGGAEWWRNIKTLDDMVSRREDFLAHPGCDVDYDSIACEVEGGYDLPEDALLDLWFDALVEALRGKATLTLHRHMTVADFDSYVAGLEDGTETTGAHWSLDEGTQSPFPMQTKVDVLLTGEVDAAQVDWFTTFQCHFSHPEEREVAFAGDIRVLSVRNLDTGESREPEALYPTLR